MNCIDNSDKLVPVVQNVPTVPAPTFILPRGAGEERGRRKMKHVKPTAEVRKPSPACGRGKGEGSIYGKRQCFILTQLIVALTSASLGLAASPDWQKEWERTVAAAKKEGHVTVY